MENGGKSLIFLCKAHYLHPKDCRAQCVSMKYALSLLLQVFSGLPLSRQQSPVLIEHVPPVQ